MHLPALTVLILLPLWLTAQQPNTSFVSSPDIQIAPAYPGGEAALLAYLQNRLNPPPPGLCGGRSGESVLSFVIEKDGSVSSIAVIRSLCPEFDALGSRILQEMPRWIPGSSNGSLVKVKFTRIQR